MVYNEKAYRSIFPEVKPEPKPKHRDSMIADDEPEEEINEIKNVTEDEMIVDAPVEDNQEGNNDDTGSSDSVD